MRLLVVSNEQFQMDKSEGEMIIVQSVKSGMKIDLELEAFHVVFVSVL